MLGLKNKQRIRKALVSINHRYNNPYIKIDGQLAAIYFGEIDYSNQAENNAANVLMYILKRQNKLKIIKD